MPKEIISVTVNLKKAEADKVRTDLLAVGVASTGGKNAICELLDKKLKGKIESLKKLGDFKAKKDSTAVIYTDEKIPAKRVLLIGLGEKKDINADTIRKAAAMAASKAVTLRAKSVAIAFHQDIASKKLDLAALAQAATEGAFYGGYRYDEYKAKDKEGRLKALSVSVIDSAAANIRQMKKGFEADGNGIKEPVPSELSDRLWRADPSDGLRPMKEIRTQWK